MDSSTSDFNNEEEMTTSENSSNVYTNYKQETADNDWVVSGKKKKAVPQAQVYTSYVQSSDKSYNKYQTANRYNHQASHLNNDTFKKEQAKKPKLDGLNNAPKEDAGNDAFINSYFSDFIGLQTFEAAANNLFMDFIENDLILVCLDSRPEFKSKFCFKGKCKLALVYGQININGYDIKSSGLLDNRNEGSKWFDLYSAETNSYVSISNTQIVENSYDQLDDNQKEDLAKQIMLKCNISIDNSIFLSLKKFMTSNEFCAQTSSLFALKILKSQMCDYLSYFDNFHHIYQSGIGFAKQQDFDSKLAKIGVFPVDPQNLGAIKIERTEEKQIVKEILENSDGIKYYLLAIKLNTGAKTVSFLFV